MERLGRSGQAHGWDWAKDRAERTAISKRIMNFIGLPLSIQLGTVSFIRVRQYSLRVKKLARSEALYEKFSRLHQDLLTPVSVRANARHHQHTRHARKQQPDLRLFLGSPSPR